MLESAVLARCPHCRNTFSTDRAGQQECPACGKALVVPGPTTPSPPAATPVGELARGQTPSEEARGTPWERRDELGLFEAWKQTTVQALFEPGKLFASARLDRGPAQLGYALLTASIFSAVGQLLSRLLLSDENEKLKQYLLQIQGDRPLSPLMKLLLDSQNNNSARSTILVALATPLLMLLLLYLNAAITHGAALLLGQARRGFPATFAACAYAFAPAVLAVVPGCGSLIAIIWVAVLTGVGMKQTQRISSGGAAAAVFAPYLVLCCVGCAGSVAIAMRFGQLVTGR